MDEILEALCACMLFRDIPERIVEEYVLPCGTLREYPKDSHLIMYQEQVDYLSVVVSGRINTQHVFPDGSYSIIDTIEVSEVLGADLICTKSRVSPYFAVAAVPSQVLMFPISFVMEKRSLPEEYRLEVINKLLMIISNGSVRKDYRLAILSQKGLRERIMTYLTMQADKRHYPSFQIPFSREELASYLCVNRSALSNELGRMRDDGLVSFWKDHFILQNWKNKGKQ
ncbi:MAG: Crp/Fnr family transcriptional regulator [Oscillospiraceae bacterium]|nr:Crp/Fnr family transcriptional regulator [Oscillospiraceae bacterium]